MTKKKIEQRKRYPLELGIEDHERLTQFAYEHRASVREVILECLGRVLDEVVLERPDRPLHFKQESTRQAV